MAQYSGLKFLFINLDIKLFLRDSLFFAFNALFFVIIKDKYETITST